MSQGRRAAVSTVAGVALGDLIAMSASLAGLGALVLASATLFTVLKWIGALYLIYLGVQMIRKASGQGAGKLSEMPQASNVHIFNHAAAVTALNPKSIVFFIAFVPQFINADAALWPQFTIMIVTFVGLAALNALVYALLADQMRARISNMSVLTWLTRLGGGALVLMGIATLVLRKSA